MGEGYYFCCKALLVCIWRNGTKYSWHFAIRGCKCRMQRHETHFFLSFWLLSDRCSAVPTRLLDYFSLPEWPRPRPRSLQKATKKTTLHPCAIIKFTQKNLKRVVTYTHELPMGHGSQNWFWSFHIGPSGENSDLQFLGH